MIDVANASFNSSFKETRVDYDMHSHEKCLNLQLLIYYRSIWTPPGYYHNLVRKELDLMKVSSVDDVLYWWYNITTIWVAVFEPIFWYLVYNYIRYFSFFSSKKLEDHLLPSWP